jgi:hypothetical protein
MAVISGINYKKIVTTGVESYDLLPFDATFGTPLAEMIIEVDTTGGACTLNLPNIADFNGFWGTKITIIALTGLTDDVTIVPYINLPMAVANTIGGNTSLALNKDQQVAELNIASDNTWYGVATL